MKIPIFDRGYSIIGEGAHAGIQAWEIRVIGCPVCCPWCDVSETWENEESEKREYSMESDALAAEAAARSLPWILITGGEPALYNWSPFLKRLREEAPGAQVQLETSGALPILPDPQQAGGFGGFDYLSVSPKRGRRARAEVIQAAHEIKIVIDAPDDFWFLDIIKSRLEQIPIYLFPEWKYRNDPDILRYIRHLLKEFPFQFRAGFQFQKLLKVE